MSLSEAVVVLSWKQGVAVMWTTQTRIRVTFLALMLMQALHSVEEYLFRFYAVFPPARLLNALLPGFARPGFIAFNVFLVLLGFWCFSYRIRPRHKHARRWMWLWVAIELFNGVGHPVWAIICRAYVPGLVTAIPMLCLAAYLAHLLTEQVEAGL